MKNSTFLAATSVAVFLSFLAFGETVRIAGHDIPLLFDTLDTTVFDTNLVAQEFSKYCSFAGTIQDVFYTNGLAAGESIQMNPSTENGPPSSIAIQIQYFSPPLEKIVVAEQALQWILSQQAMAASYTNIWTRLDAFLAEVSNETITNDAAYMRSSFVVDGDIWMSPEKDQEIRSGIESYWSRLEFFPPSVFAWRMLRLKAEGPDVPVVAVRCIDPEIRDNSISSEIVVFMDGRWRFALFH